MTTKARISSMNRAHLELTGLALAALRADEISQMEATVVFIGCFGCVKLDSHRVGVRDEWLKNKLVLHSPTAINALFWATFYFYPSRGTARLVNIRFIFFSPFLCLYTATRRALAYIKIVEA